MKVFKNKIIYIAVLLIAALILRFFLAHFLGEDNNRWLRIIAIILILGIGSSFVLRGTANVIEETTEVLSKRTKLAGGLLQSLGTAFPDMVLGLIAAIISLRLASSNYALAINFAIIAAAATFGSNIYNIGYSIWCIFRQNLANQKAKTIFMFPGIKRMGMIKPLSEHRVKPSLLELDTSIDVINILTVLTAVAALSMVLFGQVANPPAGTRGDLYQLVRPVGILIFILCIFTLYYFRKTKREDDAREEIVAEEKYYEKKSNPVILLNLLSAGAAILLAADSMVRAVESFCDITGVPYVVAGVLTGIIGCLGEIIVIHNFTINPKGKIGDAVVGVAMDNIVTILGASIVAILGGIFLGGNALIMIFVIILTLNTVLMWQISKLKNMLLYSQMFVKKL